MTTVITGREKGGNEWWIISPNIVVHSFATSPKKVTPLELFYYFGQTLLKNKKETLTKEEQKKWRESHLRVMIELDNRVQQMLYFANEANKQGGKILKLKPRKRIHSHKPYQILVGHLTAYLNGLHALREEMIAIDRLIGKNYSEDIWKQKWFKIDIDIRTLLHHIESPMTSIDGSGFRLRFERVDLIKKAKFLKDPAQTHAEFLLHTDDLGTDIIAALNDWAKKYLNLVNKDETIDLIAGYRKDGRAVHKTLTLKDLMKIGKIK